MRPPSFYSLVGHRRRRRRRPVRVNRKPSCVYRFHFSACTTSTLRFSSQHLNPTSRQSNHAAAPRVAASSTGRGSRCQSPRNTKEKQPHLSGTPFSRSRTKPCLVVGHHQITILITHVDGSGWRRRRRERQQCLALRRQRRRRRGPNETVMELRKILTNCLNVCYIPCVWRSVALRSTEKILRSRSDGCGFL